jgi:hypothetical protein
VKDLIYDLVGRLVGMVVRPASPAFQTLVTELPISVSPQIECRSCNPEISASLIDVSDPLRVLEDPLLAVNLSLIVGHLDLLGHHPGG